MKKFHLMASAAAFTVMLVPATGHAQSASEAAQPDPEAGLQQIIVTAQRRAQNLQNVPIAVNSVDGDTLRASGATAFNDIGVAAPSVNITRSAYTVSPFIRGIGNSVPGPGNDPSVAVYVDGVYQASPTGLLFSFNNIERIEVLKGPQGTLFGRNATGGLIHVISKDPQTEFNLKAGVGYANYNTVNGSLYVTGGQDRVAFDLAATYSKQFDGWGTNLFTPAQAGTVLVNGNPVQVPAARKEVGINEDFGLRARVKVEATDRLTARLSGFYAHNIGDQGVYRRALPGQINRVNGNNFVVGGGFYDINSDVDWDVNTRTYQAALDLALDLDFATLKSISAYYDNRFTSKIPSENTPFVGQTNVFIQQYSRQKTQELQLSSNAGSPVEWVVGAFYLDSRSGNDPTHFNRGNIEPSFDQYASQRTRSISAYGQATIPVGSDATHFTLGARYSRDKISASGYNIGTRTSLPVPVPTFAAGTVSNNVPLTTDVQPSFTFRVGADHKISPDVMLYASVSTGFKSGTFNVATLCPVAGIPNCLAPAVPVRPERLTAYEVGFKSELADRTVRLNGSAFYYDYKDLQVQTITGTPSQQLIQNAAKAEIYGGELELVYAPTRQLKFSAQGSYLHTRYKDFPIAVTAIQGPGGVNGVNITIPNAKGNQLNRAPQFTASLTGDYRVPVGSGELGLNLTYYYNDGFFWEVGNRLRQTPYSLVNGEIEFVPAGDHLAFRLWTKNLLNKKYYIFQQGSSNGDQGVPAAPRTFGVSINYKFR